MKNTILLFVLILSVLAGIAQNVGINSDGTAPATSAMLDVSSSTKGFLVPRMSAAERGNISSPATGLLVYQTDGTAGFYYYTGSAWTLIGTGSGNGTLTDVTGTAPVVSSGGTTPAISITAASTGAAGSMSAADKIKLDGIATAATNYTHPTGDGNLHVIATSTTNSGKVLTAGASAGSLSWATPASGTVTSVTATSPIASSGGAAPVISLGTVPVANGGTGATTLTGYIMGTGTTAMTASATIPAANISGNISGNAANVTGTVAVANGGTGTATGSITGTGALNFTAGTSGGANQNVTLTPSGTGYTLLNGNVGIGTTTPVGKLEVIDNGASSGGNTARFYNPGLADAGVHYISIGKSSTNNECALMGFSKQATISRAWLGVTGDDIIGGKGLTVQKGGNVGIGDNSPAYRFSVFNNISGEYAARIYNGNNSGTAHGLLIRAGSNGTPFGATMIGFQNIDGSPIGSITQNASTTVAYNTSSDRRLKNIIVNTHFGINDLMKIQVRDYVYKADAGNTMVTGFIAQELYEIFPNAVTKPAKAEDMWSVDYGKVTPLLVKAIQDQQATIAAQQKQIDELKVQNTALAGELKAEIESLKKAITGSSVVVRGE